jgi:alcohol dehydrogenase class IV
LRAAADPQPGLGKAIALRTDLPQIVVPTIYAGSEATPIFGETDLGRIATLKVLPEVILYDVELSLTLRPPLSVASGLNAIAHAVEAVYSPEANPVISLWQRLCARCRPCTTRSSGMRALTHCTARGVATRIAAPEMLQDGAMRPAALREGDERRNERCRFSPRTH